MLASFTLLVSAAALMPGAPLLSRSPASTGLSGSICPTVPARSVAPRAAVASEPKQKIYTSGETPKVLGALKAGTRKLVVITGASSGLGLACAKAIADAGGHYIICAVRDPKKMEEVAKQVGIPSSAFTAMKLELASQQSVYDFVKNLRAFKLGRPLQHLVCNAAVYLPTDPKAAFTDDGYEMSIGVNHLGHFLLANLLLEDLKGAKGARCCIVGSITGNSNTIGGGLVYPRADLGDLSGLAQGPGAEMIDGGNFDGAKAYKDSKVLNMMTMSELHRRYHDSTGISFSSMYPGCIAETNLFREKRGWFRKVFPLFMKYVTGGYVSEAEAGQRLAQVILDPKCAKSGVYWSWNGNAQQVGTMKMKADGKGWELSGAGGAGGDVFENALSDTVSDREKSEKMWELSMKACNLQ